MPVLPRAGWLALGAILAALLTGGGALDLGLPGTLVAATGVAVLGLVGVCLARGKASAAAFMLGLGSIALRAGLALAIAPASPTTPLPDGSGPWRAEVVDVSSPAGDQQRAFLRLASADAREDADASDWLVYAWLPRHPALVRGDLLTVNGSLEAPPADSPGFAGFLAARGAAGTLKAETAERIGAGAGAMAAVERLRRAVDESIGRAIPEPEAGLASGILVGLRERVGREVADDFTTTGLTHVVAISGWNIALVAGIATGLLRAAGLPRRVRSLLVLAAIVAYTVVAGAEASVVRAAVMGGVVLLAREGGRPAGAAAALGVACAALLLVDPGMVGDIGLQLSLAATAGLLALGGAAEAAVRRRVPRRTPGWLPETLGVSLAAQLATLPLILLHFGRLSLISPLANLLMAPFVPLAMLGAVLGAVAGPLVGTPIVGLAAAGVSLAAWLPLGAMVRSASLMADVPFASLELPGALSAVGAAAALTVLLVALRRARSGGAAAALDDADGESPGNSGAATPHPGRRSRRLVVGGLGAVLVIAVWVVPTIRPAAPLRITVLNVGQGDAILVEAGDGSRLLVDGGSDPDLLVRRLDERIPLWDRRIDLVVLTHPHEDHAGGLAGLVPRYHLGRIAGSGMDSDSPGVVGLRLAAERHGIDRVTLGQGDAFRLGSARVDVVWPPRDVVTGAAPVTNREVNDTSVVLAIRIGTQRALLMGDLEADRDDRILAAIGAMSQRWDLLKVAHHGSAGATSRALLDALRPRVAAISVGADNDYGHPAAELLERLESVDASVWRTDQMGTVSLVLDGQPSTTAALSTADRPATRPTSERPTVLTALAAATPSGPVSDASACYPRPDGGPDSHGSPGAAPVHVALGATAAARHGGGRSRVLPGLPGHPSRTGRGPPTRRDGRAPPRRRQGPAGRPPPASPGAWTGRSRLAARSRARRAGARRDRASRDAARRAGSAGVGLGCTDRGSHRVLRGQAGHAARRVARATLRAMAAQASRVRRPPRGDADPGAAPGGRAVRRDRHPAGGRGAPALGGRCHGQGRHAWSDRCRMTDSAPLAYFWGEDAYSIDRAGREWAAGLSSPDVPMETWRVSLDDPADGEAGPAPAAKRRSRTLDAIEQHLATAPLFGGGTVVVVRQPGSLLAAAETRDRFLALVAQVPLGNALCVTDLTASGASGPAAKGVLRDAVATAGGVVREFQVPPAGRLEAWLMGRAGELGIVLEPPAARLLAERVGGHVRESDVDRRRRTELANAELEKLALYRPGASVVVADVEALVSESIPGSMWAFLDAVGARAAGPSMRLADRLLEAGTPLPVLISQLHRRLRDLLLVREHLDTGSTPPQIVKSMKLQPFRAQKLAEQAQTWTLEALETALAELLALDLRSKGISLDGTTARVSEDVDALALQAWLAGHASRPDPTERLERPARPARQGDRPRR